MILENLKLIIVYYKASQPYYGEAWGQLFFDEMKNGIFYP